MYYSDNNDVLKKSHNFVDMTLHLYFEHDIADKHCMITNETLYNNVDRMKALSLRGSQFRPKLSTPHIL